MYLKSLKVQHYKSLDDVSVDFSEDVTVVVGPNGVGKSNFVDMLRFLHDAVTDDLEHAVTKRGGIQRVLPTFEEVSIQTVGSYLVPLFKFRVEGESTLTSFDPVQLSDGTLRLFGILLAAYQLPRPKLLVIEEPEQTIYPAALVVLADVVKEIGRSTQVLITTHSPHLVQCFAPSQIRVAVMHKGMTQIRPIHPHQLEAVNEGLLSLEEFMSTEGLRPDDTETTSS